MASEAAYVDALSRTQEQNWTLIIRPQRRWFDLPLRELWQYRDLMLIFVWRDFVSMYKQTILGPLWYLVQPLLTTITFTIIFGNIARLPSDGLPPFLFYMAGTVIWNYFSACIGSTSSTFITNAGLFGKVYFPRLVVPLSILMSRVISFAIQFALFLAFLAYFILAGSAARPTIWVLLTPALVVMMAGFGLAFGLIVSALTTRYRDLQQLVSFGVQLLMYASSVIYPLSAVPEQYRWIVLLNPLTPLVESFRYAFLGSATVTLPLVAYSFVTVVVFLALGLFAFHRVEATFMDTV